MYLVTVTMRILKVLYLFPMVIVTNDYKLGGLKKQKMYSLTALEKRLPKSRCCQHHTPSRDSRGESLLLPVFGGCPDSCGCIIPVSVSVFAWPSPVYL